MPLSSRRIAITPAPTPPTTWRIAELAGLTVEAVPGEESNLKVTTEKDFALAEALLGAARRAAPWAMTRTASPHGDHVWLCGVKVPHDHGLEGHSDADAGLHALTDAMLGCIGAGDIGQHFPPTDERWHGAPSWKFLDHAACAGDGQGRRDPALRRHH